MRRAAPRSAGVVGLSRRWRGVEAQSTAVSFAAGLEGSLQHSGPHSQEPEGEEPIETDTWERRL